MSIVERVYRFRTLQGQCELGAGLDFDGIDELTTLEAMFRPGGDAPRTEGRRHRREAVVLGAFVRGPDQSDRVAVNDLSPTGARISGAPYTSVGDLLEIVIDADERSYRFKARAQWVEDDGDDYAVGLAFVGLPIRLTYGMTADEVEIVIEKVAA